MSIKVTILDEQTGEASVRRVEDDTFFIVTTGRCDISGVQNYPMRGTVVLTIKGNAPKPLPPEPEAKA